MRLEGQTKLANNVFAEVQKVLEQNPEECDNLFTLKEILELLKIHPELLWYYGIPNTTGLFNLQGFNRLSSPYLCLGIDHPVFKQQNLLVEFHFDIKEVGMSFQTNNEFLRVKINELIMKSYEEKNYRDYLRNETINERKVLESITFQKEYFSEEFCRKLSK